MALVSAKLRIAAMRAFNEHEGYAAPRDPENHPQTIATGPGIIALVDAEAIPDWGARYGTGAFAAMAADDGLAISEAAIRPTLPLGGGFGDVSEPISGGIFGCAWLICFTAMGNLAQARVQTVLHLAYEQGWRQGDRLEIPRRGVFAPYPPMKGLNWDRRLYPEVLMTLKALKPLKEAPQHAST